MLAPAIYTYERFMKAVTGFRTTETVPTQATSMPAHPATEVEPHRTRREWFRSVGLAGAAVAAGAAASGVAVYALRTLLGPPARPSGRISQVFVYTKYPTSQWWDALAGEPVRVTDFGLWQGATAVWRGLFEDGTYVPGTGLPALVIRVPRDNTHFRAPTFPLPDLPGFQLYYDDPLRDVRLVAVFDRCVHLCC